MFLSRDGLLTLMNIDSFISLERFCSSLPTTVKLLIVVSDLRCYYGQIWGRGFKVFLKPLSKCSSCLFYIFMVTFQPVTFVSIYNTTLFGDMVLIFRCHQFFLYCFTTLKVNLDAISFTDVFEGFTKSFIVWNSYRVSVHRPVVWFVVVFVSWTVCLYPHSIYGPCWILAGLQCFLYQLLFLF